MTQSMESQTMLPAQHEDVEDKRKTCPVRAWAEQHKTLLIVCFGVLGVFLLMMLGNRKTVLNIENQPSQAGGNTAKVMVIDNHGFSMFQWITIGNGSNNHPTNSGNTTCWGLHQVIPLLHRALPMPNLRAEGRERSHCIDVDPFPYRP